MDSISTWLEGARTLAGPFGPRLLGAIAIVFVAWLAARIARAAVLRASDKAGLDARLHSPGFGAMLSGIAGGVPWLLAVPALLDTLELPGLLAPVNAMVSRLMAFVPNVLGAVVVLGIGLLVAGIVRQVVSGLLRAAGSERAAEQLGLASALGPEGLAGIAGTVTYVLVLLPTLVAALQPLGLDAVTQPMSHLLDTVIALIPRLVSAAIVLGVAVLIGRALATLLTALLAGLGLDSLPERLGAGPMRLAGRSLSELAGTAVMVAVLMVALTQATDILGLPVLTEIVASSGAALARVAVALLIGVTGLFLASAAARALRAGTLPNAGLLAGTARAAILFFTAALALRQAGLPGEIVTLAFGAVVGGVALGLAVAIGVGGRHVAARTLEKLEASFLRPSEGDDTQRPS